MDGILKLHDKIKAEQFVERPRPGESMEAFRRRTGWVDPDPSKEGVVAGGFTPRAGVREGRDEPPRTGAGGRRTAGGPR